ncbi:MAG: ABC transporter ATP-binding protein [Tannerellaceae bacterium]|jgi:ABC-type multidrug transport system ATPase subunit|nr:ABC transporter ATP-binding protein [Tannerellaceae bacterium]
MKAAISIHNISKSYGGKHPVMALKDICLQIGKGELFGLIGPDGAGKTSLFRILATLLTADSGTATVEGFDVVNDYREIRNRIGYMPGRFSLYQDLSVEENLEFFATVFGSTIQDNYDLIADIYRQIEPFRKRRAGKLSGGMKQKLALCCALIHRPAVLLLDEPTTGVDAVSRREFWTMLEKLKASGITVFVSTPYMDEASLCDRVALIQSGGILSVDTPANVAAAYPFTLYEIKAENNYHLLEQLKKQSNVRSCYISGEYLRVVFRSDADLHIHYPAKELKEVKPTIEDCFIQLMSDESN